MIKMSEEKINKLNENGVAMEIGKSSLQVNELRIGNYIYNISTFSQGVCRIAAIHKEGLIKLEEDDKTYEKFIYPELIPIPLTEEILLKCGFKKEIIPRALGIHNIYYNGTITIHQREAFEWGVYDESDEYTVNIELQSLHQLMNLYFALTGKELEVKL